MCTTVVGSNSVIQVLNSELPSESRQHILNDFNRSLFDTLIATDESLEEEETQPQADEEQVPATTKDNEEDVVSEKSSKKQKKKKSKKEEKGRKEADYGVSRGIDFKGVDTGMPAYQNIHLFYI